MTRTPSKKLIAIIAGVLALIVVIVAVYVTSQRGKLTATTMRIMMQEGIVNLYDKNDKPITIKENLRLTDGNKMETEEASRARVALDDTKIVTLDEKTRAAFNQVGKKLSVVLEKGSIFINVTKKLNADESFDIKTSSLVVGIRGTSLAVYQDDQGNEYVVVTDGQVHGRAVNIKTGQVVEFDADSQHVIKITYLDSGTQSIIINDQTVSVNELEKFIVDNIAEDDALLNRVVGDTDWTKEDFRGGSTENDGTGDSTGTASDTSSTGSDSSGDGSSVSTDNDGGTDQGDASGAASSASSGASSAGAEGSSGDGTGATNKTLTTNEDAASSVSSGIIDDLTPYILEEISPGVYKLADGTIFNAADYAALNADVFREYGNDSRAILRHYLEHGITEKRVISSEQSDNPQGNLQGSSDGDSLKDLEDFEAKLRQAEKEAEEQRRKEEQASSGGDNDSSGSSEGSPERDEPYDPDSYDQYSDPNYEPDEGVDPDSGTNNDPNSGTNNDPNSGTGGNDTGGNDTGGNGSNGDGTGGNNDPGGTNNGGG